MSRATEDGEHEGWVAQACADGVEASATSGAGILVGAYPYQTRPYSDVTHWIMRCSCGWQGATYRVDDFPHDKWREPSQAQEDRIFVEWEKHVRPLEALAGLRRAREARAQADLAIALEVDNARKAGASWEAIGRALGMTRQAAHERYAKHD